MKRSVILLLLIFSGYYYSFAQTNTFPSSGNVGIGTTSPASQLTLGSTNSTNPNNTGSEIPYSSLTFQNTQSGANYLIGKIGTVQEIGDYVDAGALVFYTGVGGLSERMRINSSGNLLIGETLQNNPSYKLDVGGGVRANSVVVNTTGADFVFDPAYTLKPLSYIATYIVANHHLPGIASAKEMQANGLDLGENQTKLLQKVEELTLYLIASDAKEQSQEKLIESQSEQLKTQDERIKKLEEAVLKLADITAKGQ
jgi:hypothetical protein